VPAAAFPAAVCDVAVVGRLQRWFSPRRAFVQKLWLSHISAKLFMRGRSIRFGDTLPPVWLPQRRQSPQRYLTAGPRLIILRSVDCYDGHSSVRALADTTGAVTDTYDYDAMGYAASQGALSGGVFQILADSQTLISIALME